ncbi:hypothetical protein MVES1_000945 [Malassezia vespertilionis]|uniref:Secretory carrier membrane protein n=1 Tax=Malassezia vespertilionis TaxID=2020962 RepID=A0A2N1JFE7_9BASI|nr:uncharacterized protein MVES1_000945 [Malassezia vespertilionis]PKI85245.1 hypothetical protein MVES_000891 [Malassezia vespertilionis]WFD05615.1 hypothetical protein MVES1_000945 [Malassezia vespertilionis]
MSAQSNPFDDPSVRNAMHGGSGADDLETAPFDTDSLKMDMPYDAPLEEDDEEDAMYPTSTHSTAPATAIRLEELQRREQELENRERELDSRSEHIRRYGRNNWPPFYPIVYHDISAEIPPDSQPVMINIYRLWLLFAVTMAWNIPANVLIWLNFGYLSSLITSIVYFCVIVPLSFFLWYRPVYNGLMKEHSLFYYIYFVFGGFHLLFSLYACIGAKSTGCAGILAMSDAFYNHHFVTAALSLVASIGFLIQTLGNAWYYHVIWQHNHEQGHNFAQAKAELASHGAMAYFLRGVM